jgi:hypothetical protein
MCYLRRDCRPGDFGESAMGKNGPGAKHKKQETVRDHPVKTSKLPQRQVSKSRKSPPKAPAIS